MKKLLLSLGAIAAVAAPVAAVIACTTEDNNGDGFIKAPLIAGFKSLADESQKVTESYDMELGGKKYTNEDEFVKDMVKDYNEFLSQAKVFFQANQIFGVEVKRNGNFYSFQYLKADKSNFSAPEITKTPGIIGFESYIKGQRKQEAMLEAKWSNDPIHISSVEKKDTISPSRHTLDSIIYSQAQSLTKVIDTEENEILFNDGNQKINLLTIPEDGYTSLYQETNIASFKNGDTITLTFKDESNLASFTQRFSYIDGQANHFNDEDATKQSEKLAVINGQILSVENETADAATSIFKLDVIAKNAVKITFLNPPNHGAPRPEVGTGQFLYLNGFTDINKDGKIDVKDQSIAGPYTFK